jgi:hypothetical protein
MQFVCPQHRSEHTHDEDMQSGSEIVLTRPGTEQSRLLRNGAAPHEFTREDRARGGRARTETAGRRQELRAQLDVAELQGVGPAEPALLDRALARPNLLIGSDDRWISALRLASQSPRLDV